MNYQVFFCGVFLSFIGFAASIPFDGSQVPQDCLKSHVGDYLREHEYNCSKFWKCLPFADDQRPNYELFDCPYCGSDCFLSFDIRTGGCDWDYNVNCTNGSPKPTTQKTTSPTTTTPSTTKPLTPSTATTPTPSTATVSTTKTPSTTTASTTSPSTTTPSKEKPSTSTLSTTLTTFTTKHTDTDSTPFKTTESTSTAVPDTSSALIPEDGFCSTSDECSARCGGECCNGKCKYSECCDDSECENGNVCHPLSGMCVECHQNADCTSDSGCDGSCFDSMCRYPECCADEDCTNDLVCNSAGTCVRCLTDENCPDDKKCNISTFTCWSSCANQTQSECPNWNNLCNTDRYENCQYCEESFGACQLGCGQDANCPSLYTPKCDLTTHQCGCWKDEDCVRSSRNPVCDLATKTCVDWAKQLYM